MSETTLKTTIQDYLQAIETRNLEQCVNFYTDNAVIHFGTGVYQGKQSITDWHKDRFAADLKITQVEKMQTQGNQIEVELKVTSNRLKAWRVSTIKGKGTFHFIEDKINEVHFGLAGLPSINVYEGWQ